MNPGNQVFTKVPIPVEAWLWPSFPVDKRFLRNLFELEEVFIFAHYFKEEKR